MKRLNLARRRGQVALRARSGQSMVEFALVLPLLFTLIFGIMELGFLFFQDHTINSVCRRAARQAAVGMTDAEVRAFVRSQCPVFGLTDAQIQIVETDNAQVTVSGNPRTPGDDIRIAVTHNLIFLTPVRSVFESVGLTQVRANSAYIVE